MMRLQAYLGLIAVACFLAGAAATGTSDTVRLTEWEMVSSSDVSESGTVISTTGYSASSWYDVDAPCTVIAGLLQNDVYEDPFYGLNLLKIRPADFDVPWWFRTTFDVASFSSGSRAIITFYGINYKADLYLNGEQLLASTQMVGTFRIFDVDITEKLAPAGEDNVLALYMTRPVNNWSPPDNHDTDLAISFVDWNPYAVDNSMGVWMPVELQVLHECSVAVRYPIVDSKVASSLTSANLTLAVELENFGSSDETVEVTAEIEGVTSVTQQVRISAHTVQQLSFSPDDFPTLALTSPRLWWPFQMGSQELYNLTFTLTTSSNSSDSCSGLKTEFGIREVTSELTDEGYRVFLVNGNKIMIAGAGYSPDLFLRVDDFRQESEFLYWRDMGINAVRLEGKMQNDEFYRLADKHGILMMPGWCCCDSWQHWEYWTDEDYLVASESVRSQVKRLRIHPSMLVFLYSSDELPPADVEQLYLDAFEAELWPNPTLSSAANFTSPLTGPSGVKMSGPYVWEPPNYWLEDTVSIVYPDGAPLGGAFGFLTEGGPGASPMTFDSINRTIPADKQWPINFWWDYHCGNQQGLFGSLEYFTPPLDSRYGSSSSAEEYTLKSQVASYESHRAMYEAYTRNKYTSTGVIHWMLNNAFPSNIWHLYDYYLDHGGAYFGTKKAMEPVHGMFSYHDRSIWAINNRYTTVNGLSATASVYNTEALLLNTHTVPMASNSTGFLLLPDEARYLFKVPSLYTGDAYFVRVEITDVTTGNVLSTNTYWYSSQEDVLAWDLSNYYITPVAVYADMTSLQNLAPAPVTTTVSHESDSLVVTVSNPGSSIAFFIYAKLVDAAGEQLLPCIWSDNYVTLLPGEERVLTVTVPPQMEADLATASAVVSTWNDFYNPN